jgi:hypothetical protein
MAETIRLELARDVDGEDLRERLAQHGLRTRLLDEDGACELEVSYAREESERLADDLAAALEEWVSERGLPLVPAPVDDGAYALRPPGD